MSDVESVRPLVFVAMPFGVKHDPCSAMEIDFDDIYARGIKPPLTELGLEVVRADDERTGGFIHTPMYERLLLAEIVVADLTLLNPNVFYELGVRHAARPHATVMIFANVAQLPFDVAPLRAIPYELEEGRLTEGGAQSLRESVRLAVASAMAASETDSPLFQLIQDYPGVRLPHDSTEAFRDRVRKVAALHDRLRELAAAPGKAAAIDEVRRIEEAVVAGGAESELLVDVLFTYRDLEAFDDMIRCVEGLPRGLQVAKTIQEALGFALNRRGDRAGARRVLQAVIDRYGPSPEVNGLLGRVHKDLYRAALDDGDEPAAELHLDDAIDTYRAGFEADPRDHYPGVNAVTLLVQKGTPDALAEALELATIAAFAVSRRGGLGSSDYWDLATVLELAAVRGDEATATRAAVKATQTDARDWMYDTTLANLTMIRSAFGQDREPWLSAISARLAAARTDDPDTA
ncbi:MAG: DUF4071 domain-containing protein [Acidimicrobiia bacterium]|nr:DUF4071 domain-containing protein [Acidimicrobiia bacterium]